MNRRSALWLSAVVVLMGGLVLYRHRLHRQDGPEPLRFVPPIPGAGDGVQTPEAWGVTAGQTEILFTAMLTALKERQYDKAHGLLHPASRSAWGLEDFSRSVGGVRDAISDRWAPTSIEMLGGSGPKGPYCRCAYRLEADWRSKYVLSLTALDDGGGFAIISFGMTCPYSEEHPGSEAAKKIAKEFIACMEKERYNDAIALLRPKARSHVSPAKLAQVRSVVWHKPGRMLEVSSDSCRKLTNGLWLDTIFFCSKDEPVSFFAVMVADEGGAPMVASFDMKVRADGR